ncbi:MAG: hypothetical protein IKO93_07740 [Lentisphaeria bacterium]|nr:hypothetical protein [Lentisphaeria bacterium]
MMMKSRKIGLVLAAAGMLLFGADAFAQLQLFSTTSSKKDRKNSEEPTTINSDAMDIDMANDKITLLGNVDVQDPEMNIKCRKMIIYLGKSEKKSEASTGDSTRDEQSGKEVVKIECIGDVVITRLQVDSPDGKKENQQAFAGKAIYMVKEETITLTEDPVLVNGPNRLMGERIILHTRTERVMVFKGTARTKGKIAEQK